VLFLFVIMLLGVDRAEDLSVEPFQIQRPLAVIVGVAISGLIIAAVVRGRSTLGEQLESTVPGDDNIRELARSLYSDNVFAFELTSVLLIVAVVGTVVLTRRQRGGASK